MKPPAFSLGLLFIAILVTVAVCSAQTTPNATGSIAGPHTPPHAQFRSRLDFGSLWTFGLKGTF